MLRNDSCPACGRQTACTHRQLLQVKQTRTGGCTPPAPARASRYADGHDPQPALPRRATHRVPNLQLDLFPVDVNHACAKLHADSEVMDGLKALVCELQEQAGLAHACAVRGRVARKHEVSVIGAHAQPRPRRASKPLRLCPPAAPRRNPPVSPMMMYLNRYLRSDEAGPQGEGRKAKGVGGKVLCWSAHLNAGRHRPKAPSARAWPPPPLATLLTRKTSWPRLALPSHQGSDGARAGGGRP